ncbi:MAG: AarF/ABC1/UbiB kinase family protein [Deltaproteobacteria bacterium]|nr:AarF/ABC1/UbiB kinase family protein [Deltaproteobacteria bacterium]
MLSIRKIGVIGRTYRNLNRYRQILAVLFKYGFGDLLELLKLDHYVSAGLQLISKKQPVKVEKLTRPQGLRMALEELGPTYIKLGQILSTRPDLIPVDFLQELSRLQDKVPPFPAAAARKIIETELEVGIDILFSQFDDIPLASASIGQVHRARLQNGQEVALKVQRPGIQKVIEVDLEIMLHLATLMEHHIEELAFHRPIKIVEEFARTLEKELDYLLEAANMERAALNFSNDPSTLIPAVFRELSTVRVLTTECVKGIKVSNIEKLDSSGLDRKLITSRGADILLRMIFEHGFFQADPHPGNIFVLPDNVICLIDFGMVGSVDRRTRETFGDLLGGIVKKDASKVAKVLLQLTLYEEEPDIRAFEIDVTDFMAQHLFKPLKDVRIGKLLHHLLDLASRHRLRIPPNIFLMMKSLTTVEGVARMLDPEFDIFGKAAPFIRSLLLERYSPQRLSADVFQLTADLMKFTRQFPQDLLDVARLARRQQLSLRIENRGLERTLSTHDQISNRLSFSIIIAALIIGSALIVISETPPFFYGISLIGIIGFSAAALMGIWLLVAILRKGRL